MYCLNMLAIALQLALHDEAYEDLAVKFLEHFALIASAMNQQGLWDERDGFYYDVLHLADGSEVSLRARSMVGLIPLFAVTTMGRATAQRLPEMAKRFSWFLEHKPDFAGPISHVHTLGMDEGRMFSIVDPDRLGRILQFVLSEEEFLSPYGVRALSRSHREHPFELDIDGASYRVDYEPGESTSVLFGGNSNWRGPVWFPVNYLVIEALRRYDRYFGDDFKIELPSGSGHLANLDEVADELTRRLIALFVRGPDGRRPACGNHAKLQADPAWSDLIPFHEYFHGDTGAGLGASHQTGWTGLVADLIVRRGERSRRPPLEGDLV